MKLPSRSAQVSFAQLLACINQSANYQPKALRAEGTRTFRGYTIRCGAEGVATIISAKGTRRTVCYNTSSAKWVALS